MLPYSIGEFPEVPIRLQNGYIPRRKDTNNNLSGQTNLPKILKLRYYFDVLIYIIYSNVAP